jgi:hypothetical protein
MTDFDPVEIARSAEHYEELLSHMAELQARYFARLIEHGASTELANGLVMQWSLMFWQSVMFPGDMHDAP